MPGSTTTIITTNALTASVSGVGVIIFGVQTGLALPILLAGVIGGATAMSYLESASLIKRACEIITASLLAGYASPLLSLMWIHTLAKFNLVASPLDVPESLPLVVAFLVGYMAHGVLLPGVRTVATSFIRRFSSDK